MLRISRDERGWVIAGSGAECVLGRGRDADQVGQRVVDLLRFNGIEAVEIYLQGVIDGAAVLDRQWRKQRKETV